MFTIRKRFTFSAAHHLPNLLPDHPCSRQHGHNYVVIVELRATDKDVWQRPEKWVRDFGELRAFKLMLDTMLDHRDLNEVLTAENTNIANFTPTAELLAYFFWRWCRAMWAETYAVEVSETENVMARYSA